MEGVSCRKMLDGDAVQALASDGRMLDVYYGAAVTAYPLRTVVPETDF